MRAGDPGDVRPLLVAGAVRALARTLRVTVTGTESLRPLWREGVPLIYAVWHGHVLLAPWVNARLRRTEGARPVTVLASRSHDGALAAGVAERFGLSTIRGSSSRGGARAFRQLAACLARGEDVVVVPDGPRGPREHVRAGIVVLAAVSGAPVVPLAIVAHPAVHLRSWDRFLVPWPWARCAVVFGDPVRVDPATEREVARKDVAGALAEVSVKAARQIAA